MNFFFAFFQSITGLAYIVILFFLGVYFTFYLKFIQFKKLFPALRQAFCPEKNGSQKTFSSFEAASTALAGAMGTGNIAGVASAVAIGGPGAVFWMVVSAFFSMSLKYAEIFLAAKYRGGPAQYMKKLRYGEALALCYSFFTVAASFGIGNFTQANSAAEAMSSAFDLPRLLCGGLIALLFLAAVLWGNKMVGRINSFVIPAASGAYLLLACGVLFLCRKTLPEAIALIFKGAFSFSSAAGGLTGFFTAKSVRFGISRGIFSNEAGLGSSAIAHGSTLTSSPKKEALWGIAEVFLDTVLMCGLTGVVLVASHACFSGEQGVLMTAAAFVPLLGKSAKAFIALASLVFAAASISGWYYYGSHSMSLLFSGKAAKTGYFLFFLGAIFLGCFLKTEFLFSLSDSLNILMALPNLFSLFILRKDIDN